jgi:hypothetical protein
MGGAFASCRIYGILPLRFALPAKLRGSATAPVTELGALRMTRRCWSDCQELWLPRTTSWVADSKFPNGT